MFMKRLLTPVHNDKLLWIYKTWQIDMKSDPPTRQSSQAETNTLSSYAHVNKLEWTKWYFILRRPSSGYLEFRHPRPSFNIFPYIYQVTPLEQAEPFFSFNTRAGVGCLMARYASGTVFPRFDSLLRMISFLKFNEHIKLSVCRPRNYPYLVRLRKFLRFSVIDQRETVCLTESLQIQN